MRERQEIIKLAAITLIIGLVAVAAIFLLPPVVEGDLVVDSYTASLSMDGTLVERYIYEVKTAGEYRMLYRNWEVRLAMMPADTPYLEFIDIEGPEGCIAYMKDWRGDVLVKDATGASYRTVIDDLALKNEAGIYDPGYLDAGRYTVTSTYRLHPPLATGGEATILDLLLADEHVPYRSVSITLPSAMVEEVSTRPATYAITRDSETIVIRGESPLNEPLGLTLLLSPDAEGVLDGFVTETDGTPGAGGPLYTSVFAAASVLRVLGFLAVLALPFLFVGLYLRYGLEEDFSVPEYLSFVPDPSLPPWQVNLVFAGDSYARDEDALYATLLDLHRRGKIRICEQEEGVTITVLDDSGLDSYERRTVGFIRDAAGTEGVLDTEELEKRSKKARRNFGERAAFVRYGKALQELTCGEDRAVSGVYGTDGRRFLRPLVIGSVLLFAASFGLIFLVEDTINYLMPAVFLFAVAVVQTAVAWHFPATLFGTWTDNSYRKKLEWDAFARFLSDLARIREYAPPDLPMWGEWLVYGTALGVGDRVEEAMEALGIDIFDAGCPRYTALSTGFAAVTTATSPAGGSGGGGGGFGGGGAGGR